MSTGQAAASAQPLPPDAQLLQLAFGPMLAQALYVAAKLNVADLLAEKPLPINELAARTETHERALYRILRSLTSVGNSSGV